MQSLEINLLKEFLKFAEEKKLIIMRGMPGSGKSYKSKQLSEKLSAKTYGSDDFFMVGDEYKFDPAKIVDAHNWNQKRVGDAMVAGENPIIVDNTNLAAWEMRPYVELAKKHGYKVQLEEPESDWWKEYKTTQDKDKFLKTIMEKQTHGVPPEALESMLSSYQPDVTEEDILKARYPWEEKEGRVEVSFRGITNIEDLVRLARTKQAYLDIDKDEEKIKSFAHKEWFKFVEDKKFRGNIIILYDDVSKDPSAWNFTVTNLSNDFLLSTLILAEQDTHKRPYGAFLAKAQNLVSTRTNSTVSIEPDNPTEIEEHNVIKEEKFNIYDETQPKTEEQIQMEREEKWNRVQPEKNT
jgi:predicted kinase